MLWEGQDEKDNGEATDSCGILRRCTVRHIAGEFDAEALFAHSGGFAGRTGHSAKRDLVRLLGLLRLSVRSAIGSGGCTLDLPFDPLWW